MKVVKVEKLRKLSLSNKEQKMKIDKYGIYKQMRKCTPGIPRKPEKLLGKGVVFIVEAGEFVSEFTSKKVLGAIVEGFWWTENYTEIKIIVNRWVDTLGWHKEYGWRSFSDGHALNSAKIREIKFQSSYSFARLLRKLLGGLRRLLF